MKGEFVPESAYTGESKEVQWGDGRTSTIPLATVYIYLKCSYVDGIVMVGVVVSCPDQVLLGNYLALWVVAPAETWKNVKRGSRQKRTAERKWTGRG